MAKLESCLCARFRQSHANIVRFSREQGSREYLRCSFPYTCDDRPIKRREEISRRVNHAGVIRRVHFEQMIQSDESAELLLAAAVKTKSAGSKCEQRNVRLRIISVDERGQRLVRLPMREGRFSLINKHQYLKTMW